MNEVHLNHTANVKGFSISRFQEIVCDAFYGARFVLADRHRWRTTWLCTGGQVSPKRMTRSIR